MITKTNRIDCTATFGSSDRRYRYDLCWRSMTAELQQPLLTAWLLNPSNGDERSLDPTLRKVHEFAVRNGFPGIRVINLCARVDPVGKNVRADPEPFRSENWQVIRNVLAQARETKGAVVCAWGGQGRIWQDKALSVAAQVGVRLFAFRFLDDGTPGHVGRVTVSRLRPWRKEDGSLASGVPHSD